MPVGSIVKKQSCGNGQNKLKMEAFAVLTEPHGGYELKGFSLLS